MIRLAPPLGSPLLIAGAAVSAVYAGDVWLRDRIAANRARAAADKRGKPLLNVGCGTDTSSFTGAKLWGDVNCDAAADKNIVCDAKTVCHCDATDLSQFRDKQFGAVLASNVLCYVPDRAKAVAELNRIADEVFVSEHIVPWMQIGYGPKFPVSK